MLKHVVLLALMMLLQGCAVDHALVPASPSASSTFEAKAGKFYSKLEGEPSADLTFTATMRLTGEAYGSPWAPTAYVGILEGPDLRDSVQVMLSRNLPTDPLARVEYRVFSSGKLESEGSLLEIDSRTPVEVRLEFHTGKVRLTVNEKVTDAFSTQLKLVKRYAAVSSGSAEIKFAP